MSILSVKDNFQADDLMIESCRYSDDFYTRYYVSVYNVRDLEEIECIDAADAEENDKIFSETIERYFGVN